MSEKTASGSFFPADKIAYACDAFFERENPIREFRETEAVLAHADRVKDWKARKEREITNIDHELSILRHDLNKKWWRSQKDVEEKIFNTKKHELELVNIRFLFPPSYPGSGYDYVKYNRVVKLLDVANAARTEVYITLDDFALIKDDYKDD